MNIMMFLFFWNLQFSILLHHSFFSGIYHTFSTICFSFLFEELLYRSRTKYWPPYDTNYGLFLIVLWKNYEKISHSLGLDDLFATSKPNKCEIFHNFFIKRSEIGHILYHRGANTFVAPCMYYILPRVM